MTEAEKLVVERAISEAKSGNASPELTDLVREACRERCDTDALRRDSARHEEEFPALSESRKMLRFIEGGTYHYVLSDERRAAIEEHESMVAAVRFIRTLLSGA